MNNSNSNIESDFLSKFSIEDLQKIAFIFQSGKAEPILPSITLEDYKREYISHMNEKGYSKAYIISSEFTLKKFIKYFGTAKTLKEIDLRSAEKFIYSLQKDAPSGSANYLRNMKVIFNQAVKWEYLNENVFKRIKLPKKQKTNPAYINPTEMEMICNIETNQTLKDIYHFSFYTGARLSETINITWKEIDLQERNIYIGRNYNTKSRKERTVPICEPLYEILMIEKKRSQNN